jgi:hypothetical protein
VAIVVIVVVGATVVSGSDGLRMTSSSYMLEGSGRLLATPRKVVNAQMVLMTVAIILGAVKIIFSPVGMGHPSCLRCP